MALIQATLLAGEDLYLSAPGTASLHVARPDETANNERAVVVWDDEVRAVDGGEAAAAWVSAFLEHKARLVYCPPSRARTVDRNFASAAERVAFADGFPLLVLGYASIEDINARLQSQGIVPIGVERFRPNLVVEDAEPFAEDTWKQLHVASDQGDVRIEIVKPCARCSIISVDPRTGVQGVEPMRTLATYRRRGADVYVGQNALPYGAGRVATGARVRVE
jgi:uncharacterized protein